MIIFDLKEEDANEAMELEKKLLFDETIRESYDMIIKALGVYCHPAFMKSLIRAFYMGSENNQSLNKALDKKEIWNPEDRDIQQQNKILAMVEEKKSTKEDYEKIIDSLEKSPVKNRAALVNLIIDVFYMGVESERNSHK